MEITQGELARKYEISESLACMLVAGIKPTGKRMGTHKPLKVYDEKEAAQAVVNFLKERSDKKRKEYDEARARYMKAFATMRESGLVDNPRWRL